MKAPDRPDALVVSASFLRAAFGGASAAYSLHLGQPCSSVVVVHLLLPSDAAGSSVRLSSDRLCFTPENCHQPQLVRVEALENHSQWSVIAHRLFSLDRNYDRAGTPNVVVQTEATPLECPVLTFGGLMTKRKAAAMGSSQSTRLDILSSLPTVPEDAGCDALGSVGIGGATAAAASTQDVSWCMSHLASGNHFSVAAVVQPKGTTLLSWGNNTHGELGNGTMTSSPTPQQVITFPMQLQREPLTIAHISCGKHHVAVITGQAKLFTWGNNKYGQLGLGDFSPRTQPEEVHFALATLSSHRRALRVMHTVQRGGNNVTHVACGAAHTLFMTHQQQILGMGYNQAGQLGLGHRLQQRKGWRSCTPIAVDSLLDQSILDLAAGQNHSACCLSNGDVYTWGCGDDGRLGDGKHGEGVATPTLISLLKEVSIRARAVRCGARHMAVISDSDLLYMWGANDFGQLGCKDKKPRSRPFLLTTPALLAEGVGDVALGEFHTTCVTTAGKAYTWGLNLRDNSALIGSHDTPQRIELPEKERVRKISCGWTHTNIVTYISAEEASASGQGTNFDRKMERERLLQRKAEVARWRAFVATAMPSTSHKIKQESRLDPGEHYPTEKSTTETNQLPSSHEAQSNNFVNVAVARSRVKTQNLLKKLVVAYAGDAMTEAMKNLSQHLRAIRRNISSAKGKRTGNESERHSPDLKGIFYRNQLRPPELPVTTGFSPTLHRKIWSAPAVTSLKECTLVSLSTSFRPKPPLSSCPTLILPKPSELEDSKEDRNEGTSTWAFAAGTNRSLQHNARTPTFKRTANPSPRSHATAFEALMHRPSYSITQGALTSSRSRPAR